MGIEYRTSGATKTLITTRVHVLSQTYRFFFLASHLGTAVVSVHVQLTPTLHTHTTLTPHVHKQTYNYTQIKSRPS